MIDFNNLEKQIRDYLKFEKNSTEEDFLFILKVCGVICEMNAESVNVYPLHAIEFLRGFFHDEPVGEITSDLSEWNYNPGDTNLQSRRSSCLFMNRHSGKAYFWKTYDIEYFDVESDSWVQTSQMSLTKDITLPSKINFTRERIMSFPGESPNEAVERFKADVDIREEALRRILNISETLGALEFKTCVLDIVSGTLGLRGKGQLQESSAFTDIIRKIPVEKDISHLKMFRTFKSFCEEVMKTGTSVVVTFAEDSFKASFSNGGTPFELTIKRSENGGVDCESSFGATKKERFENKGSFSFFLQDCVGHGRPLFDIISSSKRKPSKSWESIKTELNDGLFWDPKNGWDFEAFNKAVTKHVKEHGYEHIVSLVFCTSGGFGAKGIFGALKEATSEYPITEKVITNLLFGTYYNYAAKREGFEEDVESWPTTTKNSKLELLHPPSPYSPYSPRVHVASTPSSWRNQVIAFHENAKRFAKELGFDRAVERVVEYTGVVD